MSLKEYSVLLHDLFIVTKNTHFHVIILDFSILLNTD